MEMKIKVKMVNLRMAGEQTSFVVVVVVVVVAAAAAAAAASLLVVLKGKKGKKLR